MDPRKRKKRAPVVLTLIPITPEVQAAIDEIDPKGHPYCRILMGQYYIFSRQAPSIKELCLRPEFSHLLMGTVNRWCTEDRWVERRKERQEEASRAAEAALSTELMQARIDQLRWLLDIRGKFNEMGMVTNDKGEVKFKLEPKSLEAWMATAIKLDSHIDRLQSVVSSILPAQVANSLVPIGQGSGLSPTLKPRLSEEESLALALKLRDMRMAQDNIEVEKFQAEQDAAAKNKANEAKTAVPAETPTKKKPPA